MTIADETPIAPEAVAFSVLEEAEGYLGTELPKSWRDSLAVRANKAYSANARFKRKVRARGNDEGRDHLYSFMRHWLAALIKRNRPELFPRLPSSYSGGASLGARRRSGRHRTPLASLLKAHPHPNYPRYQERVEQLKSAMFGGPDGKLALPGFEEMIVDSNEASRPGKRRR